MVSLLQAVVTGGGGGGGYYPKPDFLWLPSWTMLPKGGLSSFGRLAEGLTGGTVLPHPGAPAGAGAVVSGLGTAGTAAGATIASSVGATIASSVEAGEVAAIASGVGGSGSGAVADAGLGAGGLMPAVSDVGDAIASALETGGAIPAVSDVGDAVVSVMETGGVLPAVSSSTPVVAASTVGTQLMTSGTSLDSILPILLPSIGIGLLKGLFLAELLIPKKKGKSYGYSKHYNQRLGQDFPEEYLRAPDIIREQQ